MYATCRATTGGTSTTPGGLLKSDDRAVAPVVPVHVRKGGVVGVGEPRLVPALGPLDEPADGAERRAARPAAVAGQPLAGREVVHGHLGHGVPGPRGEQQGPVAELGAVEDA